MSYRDISRIIKAYDKKMRLETKKERQENSLSRQKSTKKLSKLLIATSIGYLVCTVGSHLWVLL
jgi:hypothetical protein